MAQKTKKGKKSSEKEDTGNKPWPDVPKKLLSLVARKSSLMNNFSYGGVTKSWKVSRNQCNTTGKSPLPPQLSNVTGSGRFQVSSQPTTFCDILLRVGEYWVYRREDPRQYYRQQRRLDFKGFSQGVLVGTKYDPSQYYMWDPIQDCTWNLPPWNKDLPFKYVALSSSPSDINNCFVTMVITGMSKPAFVFAGLNGGGYKWVEQDCTISDPYSSNNQHMQFTNVHSKYFNEYLLQSDGEILLVFLISRKSTNAIDHIEVYRLQLDRLSWEKLERLGDRTLFMGTNCCMSITSSSLGCRSNCVYFSQEQGWWVFDMETQTVSPGWDME